MNCSPCAHLHTFTSTLNSWWALLAKCLVDINLTCSSSQNVNKKKDFPFSICLFLASVTADQWNCRPRGKWPAQNAVVKGFSCAVSITIWFAGHPKIVFALFFLCIFYIKAKSLSLFYKYCCSRYSSELAELVSLTLMITISKTNHF